ncbi:MAG: ABC transporter ATP-binding protein [Ignisphaera sp.]|jgi:peptide/nickel transport system ATP-binding protein|nr:ABC transporter ATP-binding protein [Ignisphaera sp.]
MSLVKLSEIVMEFEIGSFFKKSRLRAVDRVSIDIERGEVYGLVGESGSGKSTLGRVSLRLYRPTSGSVIFNGIDITNVPERHLRKLRRRMQLIPQDPYSSVNPFYTIEEALVEPLLTHNSIDRKEAVEEAKKILEEVGLVPAEEYLSRRPQQLSGGQLQRVAIARAMILKPDYIVADEPTSNLDASIRASIVKLISDFQKRLNQALLFISHDIALVSLLAQRIGVMYLGQLVEEGNSRNIVKDPLHPYTKALLSAIPLAEELKIEKVVLKGEIGDPSNPPKGCRLHPRCPYAMQLCKNKEPPVISIENRKIKCWLYTEK